MNPKNTIENVVISSDGDRKYEVMVLSWISTTYLIFLLKNFTL